jgi:peroxiredoxin
VRGRLTRFSLLAVWLALFTAVAQADVRLPDPEGKTHAVGDYLGKGKWTVVAVWSVDCPICKKDIFHMAFFHDEHKNRDATVLGISIDGVAQTKRVQDFIRNQSLSFPNLIGTPDTPEKISGKSFVGTPTYFIFNPAGKFVTQIVGPATQSQMEGYIKALAAEPGNKGG